MIDTVLISTGTANLASVLTGLGRVGVRARLASGPDDISGADRVVLPGVGSFGAAMVAIDAQGLRTALVDYVSAGRPLLAICLGMQLLCSASEESPGVTGLGLIDGRAERITAGVRVPQLGWNRVTPRDGSELIRPGWAYYANSYRLSRIPDGWTGATSRYGGTLVAAMERGTQLACQFHPELSGSWGTRLLARWVARTGGSR